MKYYLLATCLALAVFFSFNVVASLGATALWIGLRRRAQSRWSATARARMVFWLRVLPPLSALAFVAALLIPAYLKHEPYPSPEAVGWPLIAIALCSASGLALALSRAVAAARATRLLTGAWMQQSERVHVEGIAIPAYRLRHTTPVIAVVGVVRPQLFIAGQVLDSLSLEEMKVALAHESGHLVARDTLKRALIKVCRDLLPLVGVGRTLDRAWSEEAERAADEYAVRAGSTVALDLAAALIKIARMMPAGVSNVVPSGAFLLEASDDGVAGRVRRLTEMASLEDRPVSRGLLFSKSLLTAGLFGFTAAALGATGDDRQVLATIHTLTERVVKLLAYEIPLPFLF